MRRLKPKVVVPLLLVAGAVTLDVEAEGKKVFSLTESGAKVRSEALIAATSRRAVPKASLARKPVVRRRRRVAIDAKLSGWPRRLRFWPNFHMPAPI